MSKTQNHFTKYLIIIYIFLQLLKKKRALKKADNFFCDGVLIKAMISIDNIHVFELHIHEVTCVQK